MKLPSMNLDRTALADFDGAIKKEWLVTNGLGGYASSTVLGINTRKYHGLLVAAVHPPRDRRVFLEKLDEDVISDGNVRRFGANEFSNDIFPAGHGFLEQFSVSPFPTYVYAADRLRIRKTIFMPYETNCTTVLYNITNGTGDEVKVRFFPLINWRPFHSVTSKSQVRPPAQQQKKNRLKLDFIDPKATLLLKMTGGQYSANEKWTEKLYFREEAARGESCFDDCYQPGYFETTIEAHTNTDIGVVAAVGKEELQAEEVLKNIPSTVLGLKGLYEEEMKRCEKFLDEFYSDHKNVSASDWLNWLILSAGSFIVKGSRESEKSVIAGYHWFGVWGRDTFVSLPGLLLVTGRFEDAKEIFLTFAHYSKGGLIPNFILDEADSSAYNTVDATLWYVNAVLQYLKYTGDYQFIKDHLWKTLGQIIENHFDGTLFGIHVDADGLLSHGPQLTWVDSSVGDKPVAPRAGKAVEIQGLWYNALKIMELLASRFQEKRKMEEFAVAAEKASRSFVSKFWNRQMNCLFDVLQPNGPEDSLRPNQIIAVALDFAMLDGEKSKKVVDVVRNEFLTTSGLRTLSRKDPHYVGVYTGDRATRDKAYHNGTVWPWLLGPFATAFLRVEGRTGSQREYAFNNFLKPLLTGRILEAGLGIVGEIFDGDPPHTARGCISQAWSVAEPLRAYVEDVLQIRPECENKVLKNLG